MGINMSRGKAQPGCDADHSPPSSARVKNECKIYILFPLTPTLHSRTALLLHTTADTESSVKHCKQGWTEGQTKQLGFSSRFNESFRTLETKLFSNEIY
jgi:hypothetical protein